MHTVIFLNAILPRTETANVMPVIFYLNLYVCVYMGIEMTILDNVYKFWKAALVLSFFVFSWQFQKFQLGVDLTF